MWYDITKTLSYNKLFNFVVGARGCGKTYGFIDWAIRDFLKTGAQFVYLRRYKDELKDFPQFFDVITDKEDKFPGVTFQIKGRSAYINGKLAGKGVVLSTARIHKSTAYPLVNKICFDEFIIDKSSVYHYLPDDVTCFLELYETIARMRDVRVMFMANAITQTNPYFLYFNLILPRGKRASVQEDVLLQMEADKEFIEAKKQTRFGKITAGTAYGSYATENQFLLDSDTFIEKKTGNPEYMFGIFYKGDTYGIWRSWAEGKIWVSKDVDPSNRLTYAVSMKDHSDNTMLIKGLSKAHMFKQFVDAYKMGVVYFESIQIKNIVYEVIKMTLV